MRARWSCTQNLFSILVFCSMERERKCWREGPRKGGLEDREKETGCARNSWMSHLYTLQDSGELDVWRWAPGSSPTPGQPLMAQQELDFQSGWSHEV